ncbi:uncharacterized protein LOC144615830 [Panthera onca]
MRWPNTQYRGLVFSGTNYKWIFINLNYQCTAERREIKARNQERMLMNIKGRSPASLSGNRSLKAWGILVKKDNNNFKAPQERAEHIGEVGRGDTMPTLQKKSTDLQRRLSKTVLKPRSCDSSRVWQLKILDTNSHPNLLRFLNLDQESVHAKLHLSMAYREIYCQEEGDG